MNSGDVQGVQLLFSSPNNPKSQFWHEVGFQLFSRVQKILHPSFDGVGWDEGWVDGFATLVLSPKSPESQFPWGKGCFSVRHLLAIWGKLLIFDNIFLPAYFSWQLWPCVFITDSVCKLWWLVQHSYIRHHRLCLIESTANYTKKIEFRETSMLLIVNLLSHQRETLQSSPTCFHVM